MKIIKNAINKKQYYYFPSLESSPNSLEVYSLSDASLSDESPSDASPSDASLGLSWTKEVLKNFFKFLITRKM